MAVRAGLPSYNLSVCFADSSPSRGNGDDRRQWRKQGGAVGAAASKTQAERGGCWEPQPGCGAPLAKPFTLRGLPRPPLGRGGGTASAVTERLSRCWGSGQQSSQSRENQRIAQITNKQKRRRRSRSRRRRFAYSVSSGQWIRPWPRCCALPSCRRRRSGTRCSGPGRSAAQPG